MKFEKNDLIVIWYALIADQNTYPLYSKEWNRREDLIKRLEKQLNITRMWGTRSVDEGQTKDD